MRLEWNAANISKRDPASAGAPGMPAPAGAAAPSMGMGTPVGTATPGAVAPRSARDIPDEAKLFVAGLPPTMTNELLLSIFSPYGEVRFR